MINEIKNLKKVELHLHLDGSVLINTIHDLSKIDIKKLEDIMIASPKCNNLTDYLTKFDFPISYMQTRENIIKIVKDLVDYLEKENVIYAELRFSPSYHTKENLNLDDVIDAVLEGIKNEKVKINLILCMKRELPFNKNLEIIELAEKHLNRGVCAIDLAGDENKYPLNNFKDLFEIAKDKNIPFTIHAGENGSVKEIEKAIEFGATRIGHGVRAINSVYIQQLIKEKDILLEICPTSNIQTNAINSYENHPIYKFYKDNIKVCINTDNKTISNITLTDEYLTLYKTFNFVKDDFIKMNQYAIEKAFINDDEKDELLKKIRL